MLRDKRLWLIAPILLLSVYFRFVGLNWDDGHHLHPDERFLTMVTAALETPSSVADYFNTSTSTINPHNRGYGFYVYGTLPLFVTYAAGQITEKTGYGDVHLVGRVLSTFFDLGTLLVISWVALKYFGLSAALLTAAFYAFSVLSIQTAHFYVVDHFAVFFLTLGFAVLFSMASGSGRTLWHALGFSILFGLALACKLNVLPQVGWLGLAYLVRLWRTEGLRRKPQALIWGGELLFCLAVSFLVFRIFQPYAFAGPHIWNVSLNPKWLDNIRELIRLGDPSTGFPPSVQWIGISKFHSIKNLVVWGLGPFLATTSFIGVGYLFIRGAKTRNGVWLLMSSWVIFHVLWQSMAKNPVSRYQLPVYPLLCLSAAVVILRVPKPRLRFVVSALIFMPTLLWAFAFTRIYTRPVSRVAASEWIADQLPGVITIVAKNQNGERIQKLIPASDAELALAPGGIFRRQMTVDMPMVAEKILLPHIEQMTDPTLSATFIGHSGGTYPQSMAMQIRRRREGVYEASLNLGQELRPGVVYQLTIENKATTNLAIRRPRIVLESAWDDGLPLRVRGIDFYGGILEGLTMEVYAPDNADKQYKMNDSLRKGDYLIMSSNRLWGSVGVRPQIYPYTAEFYRKLIGCPSLQDVFKCYASAQPGTFKEELEYELIKVFESYPNLGPLRFNDQYADESFTVYDHPKVHIFKRRE